MNRLLYILCVSLVLFSACTKEEELIFDQSPEERLSGILSDYKTQLTKDDGLWMAYYGGSAILMKFNADNTVEFSSTYKDGAEDRKISYRISSSQVPELIFENHSVFHSIYEDDRSEREYEFLFESLAADKIDFVSKTDLGSKKTKLSFYKGTQDDLALVQAMTKQFVNLSYFKEIEVEGSDFSARLITFPGSAILKETKTDGKIVNSEFEFQVTKDGLLFSPAINIDGIEVSTFSFDETTSEFKADQGDKAITIKVLDTVLDSKEGVFNKFKETNFKQVSNFSYSLDSVGTKLRVDVPNFSTFQIYVEWGYVLCYAPGTEGGNWAGFSQFSFNKESDTSDNLMVDWAGYTYGNWWKSVYYNDGGQLFLGFMLDTNGLYIEQIGADSYVMVSRSKPSNFILVE